MHIETQIKLNQFQPRNYQLPLCRALEVHGFKKLLAIWPRRAGKDVCAFNLMLKQAIKKIGVYYYIFPTYSQARKVIWQSITNSQTGQTFLDFVPKELLLNKNDTEMRLTLINGSIIQLIGSDNIDSLMGTNPIGIVFSEYALQDPRAYQFLRPILMANDGWAMFISTPRGHNALWELYNIAKNNQDWFVSKLTVEETQHIDIQEIQKEIAEGLISQDLAFQEYWTSFDMGIEGSYYAKYIDKMKVKGQIGHVPWENGFKINTAWDLGVRDSTCILFFQQCGSTIRIVDSYENSKVGLDHYINILKQKERDGYVYGKHIAPHDIKVREFGTGMSRLEKAQQLGIEFVIAPDLTILDGIEAVRSTLSKIWIDETNCKQFIKAIENYRQEFDSKKKVYKSYPLHDWSSHWADSLRYLCISLPKTQDGLTAEDLDRIRNEAWYGNNQGNMPNFYKDNRWRY